MSREEALNYWLPIIRQAVMGTKVYEEALDMAIKALEQQLTDVVSRQAVLDYIYNDLGLGDEENGKDAERQMELERSYKYVKSLPSVIPRPKIENAPLSMIKSIREKEGK